MQLIIDINEEKMVRELYEFLGDACETSRYDLVAEDHESFEYIFRDADTGDEFEVDLEMAKEGFRDFCAAVSRGELIDLVDICSDNLPHAEQWDCEAVDYLIQFTIDGDILDP